MVDFINEIFKKINIENRFFVEAGANDGVSQSNTHWLENQGWTGLLVEPNFENYNKCLTSRPNSKSIHGALVSSDYGKPKVLGTFNSISVSRANGLMSGCTNEHLLDFPEMVCEVDAFTLTECLDSCEAPLDFEFLSLDVENYELEVLKGLNFDKYRPKLILMEIGCWYREGVINEHIDFMKTKGYDYLCNPVNWTPDKPLSENVGNDVNVFAFIDSKINL